MKTPFNFTEDDKPEAPSSSGGSKKLVPGTYNFIFNRVADENDYADSEGKVSGKNGWKALKLFWTLKSTAENEKPIVFADNFTCDYDPTIVDDKGNSKRESLVDMGQKKYKAVCFVAGANLENTDSLVGREISCDLIEGKEGYMELDPGAVGQNYGEPIAEEIVSETKVESKSEETDKTDFEDDSIPF